MRVSSAANKIGKLTFLQEIGLLLLSVVLFAFAFPNPLLIWGFGPAAFIALIPIFLLLFYTSWVRTFIYGLLYGLLSYSLFNYWLLTFHPLAILIVPAIYAVYFFVFFPILKLVITLFPRAGYILQALCWIAYEYLKTQGFLGYSYGVIGYTQYAFIPILQTASVAGVWGISFLVVFPQTLAAYLLSKRAVPWKERIKGVRVPLISYIALFFICLTAGLFYPADFSGAKNWRVSLIQQNVDPWRGGLRAYRQSLDILTRLSLKAAKDEPDIIIWSETSFVPAIDWHTRYRTDRESYLLVRELLEFLSEQTIPYVVGNDDGRMIIGPGGDQIRIDYNATILFNKGQIEEIYRKTHLVPFTEHFPYKHILPGVYKMLREADTHFWEKGEELTVFQSGGIKFSTPICFEDTFGYLSREFVRRGAEVIVNLTNDSWSGSVPSEMQHMAMAVFRAVENRRSMVRSSNGGITCVITPDGRITDMLPPFIEGYLTADVPVYNQATTLYTRYGDWFGQAALISSLVLVAGGLFAAALRGRKQKRIDKAG